MVDIPQNPMSIIIAIAIGILTLIAVFQVVPVVGGSIENSMPDLDKTVTCTLSTITTTSLPDAPVANVIISNSSTLSPALAASEYTLDATAGTIILTGGVNDNGTYWVNYEASQWSDSVNGSLPSAADIWGQIGPLLVLAVLALVIGLVIMYFRNAGGQ